MHTFEVDNETLNMPQMEFPTLQSDIEFTAEKKWLHAEYSAIQRDIIALDGASTKTVDQAMKVLKALLEVNRRKEKFYMRWVNYEKAIGKEYRRHAIARGADYDYDN